MCCPCTAVLIDLKLPFREDCASVQGHAERLEDLASQHQGIVSMLERRINMLETALQQERAHSLQAHGAVPQPLLEQETTSQAIPETSCKQLNPVHGIANKAQMQHCICDRCDKSF